MDGALVAETIEPTSNPCSGCFKPVVICPHRSCDGREELWNVGTMATNVTPQYRKAEEEYRKADTAAEKVAALDLL